MELKGLADQLNSACEAHFGVSQFSGIPLRDELHQANSLEPEFEAIHCAKGKLVQKTRIQGWSSALDDETLYNRKIGNREDLIKSTLKKVFEGEIKCDLKVNGKKPESRSTLDAGFYKNSTLFFFEDPEFQNGSRIWKIRICNCSKLAKKCENRDCLRLEISLTPKIDEELVKNPQKACKELVENPQKVCKELLGLWELWKSFELAPAISKQKYTNVVFDRTSEDKAQIGFQTDFVFKDVLQTVLSSAAAGVSSVEDDLSSACERMSIRSTGPASRYTKPKRL
eukprot:GHVP01020646.1.p1 GENE.GHVP01020646.1~~GHVP01020646.1.p1  ORF type:complete len:283 (+),score=44.54 GHVP01020646.1:22-870(+)